jgi:hypothetical protein
MMCHTKSCLNKATHRAHWPSGPIDVCVLCAARWVNIGDALGLVLHVERLDIARLAETLLADDEDK